MGDSQNRAQHPPDALHLALKALLQVPDDELELDRGALLIAKAFQPDLDIDSYLQRLDLMAEHVSLRLKDVIGSRQSIAALNQYLFDDEQFTGNTDAYYDPRNSYLNEVLERKTGIPVTLSVIYMEVARRLGFAVEGVGLPGHFILKHPGPDYDIYLDPFSQGRILSEDDCEQMLRAMFGGAADFDRRYLEALPRRRVLTRMLNNLKGIFLHARDSLSAIKAIDLSLCLDPDNADDIKARGLLYLELECFGTAWQDLERYLELQPEAEDAAQIQSFLTVAREQAMRMN